MKNKPFTHRYLYLAFITGALFLTGCNIFESDDNDSLNGYVVEEQELSNNVRSSPPEVVIDGVTYRVDAHVWRDFMPIRTENSTRMMSKNNLIRTDSSEIPDHIDLVQQYVVQNSKVWVPNYEEGSQHQIPYIKSKISRNGPFWEPGSQVNVGIVIENARTDKTYLLQVEDVRIAKAY